MKRLITWMAVIASVVGLLLVMFPSRGHKSTVLPRVHAQEGCSVATFNGTYGFYRTGTVPAGPLAAVGIATYDGNGNSTARQTTPHIPENCGAQRFSASRRDTKRETRSWKHLEACTHFHECAFSGRNPAKRLERCLRNLPFDGEISLMLTCSTDKLYSFLTYWLWIWMLRPVMNPPLL